MKLAYPLCPFVPSTVPCTEGVCGQRNALRIQMPGGPRSEKLSYVRGSSWQQTATQRTGESSPPEWFILLPPFTCIKCGELPLNRVIVNAPSTPPGTQGPSNDCHFLPLLLSQGTWRTHTQSINFSSARSKGPRSPRRVGTEEGGRRFPEQNASSSLH